LGEDWQDEYYVWDCAAGTGNLLAGLTNKYNVWASTLDQADVDVMKDRIRYGTNLLEDHVFQFDFLNDEFTKLPKGLQDIIRVENKRKKLVIYINPPYAEAGGTVKRWAKVGVSNETRVHEKYASLTGTFAKRELFVQFLIRVYCEIPGAMLAGFSTLKILQAPYFSAFRRVFRSKLKKMFVCPASTFDNVKGQFPIGFMVWDTDDKEFFESFVADVYEKDGRFVGNKNISRYENAKLLNDWLRPTWIESDDRLGYLACNGNDFQHQNEVVIQSNKNNETSTFYKPITPSNLTVSCIYFAVRKAIPADWLNDRDQFLYPNDGWITDDEFRADCLAYALFSNNVQSKHGANDWIPFAESEVNSRDKFASNFMSNFLRGKVSRELADVEHVFGETPYYGRSGIEFSPDANAVFECGKKLWKYYHAQRNCNVNASLYDIREYFQGRNDRGKMNNKSDDVKYNALIGDLRAALKMLAKKIEPKVYEYGFLRG